MKITVIVISYNRPRMLKEALGSINDADEVIVVDDGSDFDVPSLLKEFTLPNLSLIGSNIRSKDRFKDSKMGALINQAVLLAQGDVITYLCDDDVFDKDWLKQVKIFTKLYPQYHVGKGFMKMFFDGEDPFQSGRILIMKDDYQQMTTGNFFHKKECFTNEGVRWSETMFVSADMYFLSQLNKVHDLLSTPLIPTASIYRRIHQHNLINVINDDQTTVDGQKWSELISNKFLET